MQRSRSLPPSPAEGPGDGGSTDTTSPRVFRREGDYWTVCYGGSTVRLRDAVEVHYLARLLTYPNQPFGVKELLATVRGARTADVERARSAVSKRIRDALRRVPLVVDADGLGDTSGALGTGSASQRVTAPDVFIALAPDWACEVISPSTARALGPPGATPGVTIAVSLRVAPTRVG